MTTSIVDLNRHLLPGDPIPYPPSSTSITLGPGTAVLPSSGAVATLPGVLGETTRKKKAGSVTRLWVDSRSKRYIPATSDSVLGIITSRFAGGFRVDIGSAQHASLDALAFEGATKRSAPRFEIGTLLYARISHSSSSMEPELECVDPTTGKAEGYGELKGGLLVEASLALCRSLIAPNSPFSRLPIPFPFELTVGANGRICISATSTGGSSGETDIGRVLLIKKMLEDVDDGRLSVDGEHEGHEGKEGFADWMRRNGDVMR